MNKALQCIGLAKKAGKLVTGSDATVTAVRERKAVYVILASDASPNTAKLIHDKTASYGIPMEECPFTRLELGEMLGTAACACVALTDNGFAEMYKNISGGNTDGRRKD